MRIEFWVDYLCPITYLTHKNLIKAIEESTVEKYEILYRSFEMIDYDEKTDYDIMDVWKLHHNLKKKEVDNILNHIYPEYKKLSYVKVNGAHQLAHLAKRFNKADLVNVLLMEAYFEKNQDISDIEVLVQIGLKAGIDKELIIDSVSNKLFQKQIKLNRENAFIRDIDRVPHLRINTKEHFNGFLTIEKLITILNENKSNKTNFTYCSGGVCKRKKA